MNGWNTVLLRIAVAAETADKMEIIEHQLISFALQTETEIDIADVGMDFAAFEAQIDKYDMAILGYGFLEKNKDALWGVYKKNPDCFSVLLGMPESSVCRYLALRPGGHIGSLERKEKSSELFRLCSFCTEQLRQNNRILQIVTRKGIYAVSVDSVLYCQSDLKYVMLLTEDGNCYRKLGKLDELKRELPADFTRVHQSFLVNNRKVCGIDKSTHELILEGGLRIPYSRAYRSAVEQMFQKRKLAV